MSNKDDEITQIFSQGLYKDIYKTLDKEKVDRLKKVYQTWAYLPYNENLGLDIIVPRL